MKIAPLLTHLVCTKTFRVMKLSAFILFVCLFQSFATNSKAQNAVVNLPSANLTMGEFISAIEKQTDYLVVYSNSEVSTESALHLQKSTGKVSDCLRDAFGSSDLNYEFENNYIILSKRGVIPTALQQEKTITGVVLDAKGESVIGASVVVKGTTRGNITDFDGNFTLQANEGETIEITYIGYMKETFVVSSQSKYNIVLKEDTKAIDEVVVIGYGTQTKSRMISSVSNIKAEEINGRTVGMLTQAIAGQAPGVTSIQRSGQPGSGGTDIQIRGVGSFGASSSPLVLVDGIPGSINTTDPNDVESITFLKDAASAAIYGARAANGVILITTKMGRGQDKVKVSYNGYVGMQTPTSLPEMVSSWEYAELINEAVPGKYTAEQIQKFKDGSDRDHYGNTDYVNKFFKNSIQTGHNVSITGGGKTTQYLVSLGGLYQNGIVEKNDFTRYNARVNLTSNITDRLKVTTRAWGRVSEDNQPAPPASLDYNDMLTLISQIVRIPATYTDVLSNGDWGPGINGKGTPISMVNSDSFYKKRSSEMGLNVRLDWTVIDGLKLSAIGGYTQENGADKRFLATQAIGTNTIGPSSLNQQDNFNDYKTLQFLAEYNKTFNKHEITALVGHSFEAAYIDNLKAGRLKFPSNDYPYMKLGDADTQTNDGTASEWALDSYFGRLQYNWNMRYLAEVSMRYDGSSRFPKDNKYAFFPSVAIGWRIGEEAFIKDNVSWLNELKIKASWGKLGNQSIKDKDGYQVYYPYQTVYSGGYNYALGGAINTGLASTKLVDPTIHWETTETKDVGIEAAILNNTLAFSASYFDKYTYDILTSPGGSVSTVLGKTVGDQNSGKLTNRGVEITLSYNNSINDFKYGITGNFTYIKNKVKDLGVGNVEQANGLIGNGTIFNGYPMEIYYGYVTSGLYVDEADVADWTSKYDQKAVNANPQPGDIRYVDISGDGVVDSKDLKVLGSRVPKYSYGVTLNGAYKGFDLSVLFQGVAGVSGYLRDYAGWALNQEGQIQTWQRDERWTKENPNRNAKYPRLEVIPNTGTGNTRDSDFWILDGSYLRVKNIQLGYTVPKQVTSKMKIESLRFNVNAENLFTFSNYRKGWDPEINSGGSYYPILANYTFGVNVTF